MNDDPPRFCCCGNVLTPQEINNYGGTRCEDCWSTNMQRSVQVPRIPMRKERDHSKGEPEVRSVSVVQE